MTSTLNTVNADLDKKIDQTQDETVDISRNIKRIAVETTDTANATMGKLEEQREKLEMANDKMDGIKVQTREAAQGLDDLDKCCGLCVCPWNRYKKERRPEAKKERIVKEQVLW